jgi:hypothetical protein
MNMQDSQSYNILNNPRITIAYAFKIEKNGIPKGRQN